MKIDLPLSLDFFPDCYKNLTTGKSRKKFINEIFKKDYSNQLQL